MALRIILADDHPIVRSGVRALLERSTNASVVAEADSPDTLVKALEQHPCDLLLTDFNMPGGADHRRPEPVGAAATALA